MESVAGRQPRQRAERGAVGARVPPEQVQGPLSGVAGRGLNGGLEMTGRRGNEAQSLVDLLPQMHKKRAAVLGRQWQVSRLELMLTD